MLKHTTHSCWCPWCLSIFRPQPMTFTAQLGLNSLHVFRARTLRSHCCFLLFLLGKQWGQYWQWRKHESYRETLESPGEDEPWVFFFFFNTISLCIFQQRRHMVTQDAVLIDWRFLTTDKLLAAENRLCVCWLSGEEIICRQPTEQMVSCCSGMKSAFCFSLFCLTENKEARQTSRETALIAFTIKLKDDLISLMK